MLSFVFFQRNFALTAIGSNSSASASCNLYLHTYLNNIKYNMNQIRVQVHTSPVITHCRVCLYFTVINASVFRFFDLIFRHLFMLYLRPPSMFASLFVVIIKMYPRTRILGRAGRRCLSALMNKLLEWMCKHVQTNAYT